jgi:hypothetical protein
MFFARLPSRISLPRKGDRVDLRNVLFEDCPAFTLHYGLHTRWITLRDPLHQRLQPLRYLHDCSGYFRLERLPGGICTHWKSAAFSRRTPFADLKAFDKRTFGPG